jgi:redox-sensitive bicupin YhaK (pirin superfamily)
VVGGYEEVEMGQVTFRRSSEIPAPRARDYLPAERAERMTPEELDVRKRSFFPQDAEELELFEIQFEPGIEVRAHAHSASEIIYVTAGELVFGAQTAGPGTAIYVDADTLYGFRVGREGATFLNFRGRPKPEFFTKEAFLARRRSGAASGE